MKKINKNMILVIGTLLFLISYKFDSQINSFFKNIKLPIFDAVLSVVTNFGVVIFIALIIPSIILYTRENQRFYVRENFSKFSAHKIKKFVVPRNFKKISRGKNKKIVYLLWLTFILSFILAFIIKLIVLRQRPTEAFTYPLTNIINYSFPSMHSMVVFSLLPLLIKYMPKQKSFWIIFAFLVGFSRIYFGFHFFSDVVFGALTGYLLGNFLLKMHEKKKAWLK